MQTDTHAFIIRIWQEDSSGEGHAMVWRGSIEAVDNGPQTYYFTDLHSITRFIQEQLALKPSPSPAGWRRVWVRIWDGIRTLSIRLSDGSGRQY